MASLEINNLGKFADMSAVWSTHPEGGREGDFLTIGQTKFRWNVYKRSWLPAGETTPGGSSSETIDGDLTVGGDLHVGGDAEIEGDVTINGELHLPNGDRYKGQSSYKSIVFTRSDEQPDAPTGGSYANPLPDGNAWKDGVPQGNKPIWMSMRVFTSDGKAPQASSWSTPALMSDAEDFDVEFSPAPTGNVPQAPVSGVNGNLGWLWFDPVRNPNADWNSMNWMATRSKSQGTWSDWTIILIKGEAGDGVQSVFTITDGSTPSISGSSYPPSGWYKSVDSLTVGQGDVLWMSERRFENGVWSAWSAPVRLNGVDGLPGEDGSDIEFIYKRMNRLPNTGGNTDEAPESVDVDGAVPTAEGWEDHPSGVDATHLYEWSCQRTKSGGTWGPWVGPFVWSAWGEKGMDGDGVEYVFKLTEGNDAPGTPSTSDGTVNPSGEFIPTGWTDGPTGVSKSMPYEWVSQRKRINGTWGSFTTPALWATFSEEHTVDIDENGYWVIDGEPTGKMAIGTGVTIKGRVDVYRDSEITDSETSLESYPSSLTGDNALEIGDCWIVETGTDGNDQDVSGHLFICVATSGTLASMWKDLGEFKGEPGESSYLHIAWAQNVTFNPLVVSNPTTNPSEGRTYDWMGIKVTKTETVPAWTQFKWNYLRGKDGMDVEYVYIRTKVNTAPTITEAAVQTSERYPAVANYSNYAAGDIEYDTFQDDPNGVSEDWPYEWMSKREKVNGVWGQFLSTARLWSKWGEPGQPGESQPWVKTEVAQIVVDADAEGKIASLRKITMKCWLYVGKDRVTPLLSRCSATYGGAAVNLGQQLINPVNPYITVSVSLPANTALTTKDIAVTLANANASASTTVPVIINKAGADGRDVYKSIVFMRSASKPTKPDSNDGDYNNPVPSGTYNDDGVARQWKDGVEAGTLPVWMTSRIFSSDNQSPPQESAWSDVVLMQDVANAYDVEFTDASTESSPGTPDNPASGVTWYDPVDDASYLSSHSMNWMAQRVKVVTANGTSWSNWVVNRIRGEKGNDGAGQAYVAAIPDKIVIDCNNSGQAKRTVSETIDVKLMWGDHECDLKSGSTVTYSGGGTISVYPINQGDKELEFDYDLAANAAIQSGYIQIVLVGTDDNNVEHVAALSLPVIVNTEGEKGKTGPVLRFRGVWSDSEYYVYNDTFRDCVKYNGMYYIMSEYAYGQPGGVTHEPDSDAQNWDNIGNMQFVATELLLAEQGTIQNLVADYIRTAVTGPRVEMYGNVAKFFGNGAKANIEMMVDAEGVACLRFYDKNGEMLYDLGPRGINWLRTTVIEARFAQTYTQYVKMNGNQPDKSTSTTNQAYLYQFNAQRSNGVIEADDNYASTSASASAADGKYFVYNNVRIENNQLASGLYRPSSAPIITYSSADKAGDVSGMQAELMATYGLSQSQINAFDWTTGGALDTIVKAIKMQNYVSFESGVLTNKIAIWQENNNNASFLVNAV